MKEQEAINALKRYKTHRLAPGSFLSSILKNDLLGAVRNADKESKEHLVRIVEYCWKELPANVWGSAAAVDNHLNPNNKKEDHTEPTSMLKKLKNIGNIDIDLKNQ